MHISIGFTGSRFGMTENQQKEFYKKMLNYVHNRFEFHHGDCIGSDEQAHEIVKCICPEAIFVIHPPDNSQFRAWRKGHRILTPLPYLKRNKNIVDCVDFMLASPAGKERLRCGTWSTIRYAKKNSKKVYILKP